MADPVGIGASVPFGPWNMGVLWVVLRGWGIPNIPATSGIALYGVVHGAACSCPSSRRPARPDHGDIDTGGR